MFLLEPMDIKLRNTMLLDFYGQLLTKKQHNVLDYYYNNDYSLAEIGEILNISRQGVRDCIKRGEDALNRYESVLLLLEKYRLKSGKLEKIRALINEINVSDGEGEKIRMLMALIGEL